MQRSDWSFGRPHYERGPLVTSLCLAVVLAGHFALTRGVPNAISSYGFIPDDVFRSGGVTFLTSFVLHGDGGHLIVNSFGLVFVGWTIERHHTRWTLPLLLLVGHAGGMTAELLFTNAPNVPVVGASAGIAALAATVLTDREAWNEAFEDFEGVRFMFSLIAWLGGDIVFGIAEQLRGVSNVSALGHVGGAVAALPVAVWVHRHRTRLAFTMSADWLRAHRHLSG